MDRRMRFRLAQLYCLSLVFTGIYTFIPGADGPITNQVAIEGGNTTLFCDTSTSLHGDEFMLLVWYKNNVPIFSYDIRNDSEWLSEEYNSTSGRVIVDRHSQLTGLTITTLREDDEALYHCRVEFSLSPTRNVGVALTIIILPSQPFFLDELGNKVEEKIGPYHEGDTLVLSCLVIGGRPPPRISWYSGETLVDASDGPSEIPGVRENELYFPLNRESAAGLSCRTSNTNLRPPLITKLQIELYLPAHNVSIHWVNGTSEDHTLQVGTPATAQCTAIGSYPAPDLSWWLDHRHLTQHSHQSWNETTNSAASVLVLTPSVADNGGTLACVATNPAMAPSRGSKADVITLNVTYSPIVEVVKLGDGRLNEIIEPDPMYLECEVKANPPAQTYVWYYNDIKMKPHSIWGDDTASRLLKVEETTRQHAGQYSCGATNRVGETRAEHISITVLYPPECTDGVVLLKETIHCYVTGLPAPDTYFWHIQPNGLEIQHLTTGSPILHLSQINGPLTGPVKVKCTAGNGIASQDKACEKILNLEHLRPPQPQQCDLAYEYEEFRMRCIPVENATYYELSVWRLSASNASLILEHRGSMGFGNSQALAQGGIPWLVRGGLGKLNSGDEAGASACNRYGCSSALLLRPSESLLHAASPPWWHFFLEKDVGISIGAVVLVIVFVISTVLLVRLARRARSKTPAPVIQVLQLDEVAREYLDSVAEHKAHASCSLRSCSSGYSDGSLGTECVAPPVDRLRKPRPVWEHWDAPPPDVTLTLHRESAV